MINPISAYSDAGTRAARARHHDHDEALAQHFDQWSRRGMRLESPGQDRQAAEQAFRDAYRAEAEAYRLGMPPVA